MSDPNRPRFPQPGFWQFALIIGIVLIFVWVVI